MTFDPKAKAVPGKVNVATFRCPCSGVCFDVTPGLAHWTGVRHYKCDKCGATYAKRISEGL